MKTYPSLSVIVLCYNQRDTIRSTLDSAEKIPIRPLEIVVCDDGSSDGSPVAIRAWAAEAERRGIVARLVLHEVNGGTRANVLSGCMEATGRYVKLIGGDDRLIPEGVAEMLAAMCARGSRVAFGWGIFESEDPSFERSAASEKRQRERYIAFSAMSSRRQRVKLLQCNRAFAPTAIYDRLLLLEHLRKIVGYRVLEDWPLWLSFAESGTPIRYFDIPVAVYRVHEQGVSNGKALTPNRLAYRRDLEAMMEACEKLMPIHLPADRVQMHLDHIRLKKENGLLPAGALRCRVALLKVARKILTLGRSSVL